MSNNKPARRIETFLVPTLCVGTPVFQRSALVSRAYTDAERRRSPVPTRSVGTRRRRIVETFPLPRGCVGRYPRPPPAIDAERRKTWVPTQSMGTRKSVPLSGRIRKPVLLKAFGELSGSVRVDPSRMFLGPGNAFKRVGFFYTGA